MNQYAQQLQPPAPQYEVTHGQAVVAGPLQHGALFAVPCARLPQTLASPPEANSAGQPFEKPDTPYFVPPALMVDLGLSSEGAGDCTHMTAVDACPADTPLCMQVLPGPNPPSCGGPIPPLAVMGVRLSASLGRWTGRLCHSARRA